MEPYEKQLERMLLKKHGFFPWGFGHWIHENDEGTIWPQDEALELIFTGNVPE